MYRKNFVQIYLDNNFKFEEAISEIDFVLQCLFNYEYKDFMLGKKLNETQIAKVNEVIRERVFRHKPIQQIIGQAYFCSERFFVNEYTLIPRPETEILVEETIRITKENNLTKILDIGTGTGCIPISIILKNPKINAHAVDISQEALEVAKRNALLHNIYEKINFYKSDLFENVNEKFDIIISNPPYIPLKDKETLEVEVKDFDPPTALFTKDEDGTEFYEKIIKQAKLFLNPCGYLVFELGKGQYKKVSQLLFENKFKDIKVIKDINTIERIIIAQN